MNYAKWIEHFTRNHQNRPEPDWAAPVNIPPAVLKPVLKAIGGTRDEFYSEITRQMTRFVRSLHRREKRSVIPALWAKPSASQLQPAK